MSLKLQFWGAADHVTGSLHHLITPDGLHFFLDCGLNQGSRREAEEKNKTFPIHPTEVDVVVLSHAHLDHCGNLPTLVKQGFRGPIICTEATADLLPILLTDSAHLMQRDIEFINKRKISRGQDPIEPLYTLSDVQETIGLVQRIPYNEMRKIGNSVTFRFHDAGHILGSAITEISWNASNGEGRKLVYTGDLGRDHLPILRDPVRLESAHYLIVESTYGGRFHDSILDVERELAEIVNRAIQKKSKILIPAFSVGRTQEILYVLNTLLVNGDIPPIPIFLDSPMAIETTRVFRKHFECYDTETMEQLSRNIDPLYPPGVSFTKTVEESKALNSIEGACIIISASGMCEGGRIVHHIANHAGNADTQIVFVGYQAENTLGRKILEGNRQVNLHGDPFTINCEIRQLLAFSAHADEQEILTWLSEFNQEEIRQVFLVHGEEEARLSLKHSLNDHGYANVHVARPRDIFKLG